MQTQIFLAGPHFETPHQWRLFLARSAQQTTRGLLAYNEQTLTALSTVFATVSYTFGRAKATYNCVQLCTSQLACTHPQPTGCQKELQKHDVGHYSSYFSSKVLQGVRHVLVEGGATSPDFSGALEEALDAVQVAFSADCRLDEWTCMFDDLSLEKETQKIKNLNSFAEPEHLKGEAVDWPKRAFSGLQNPRHVELQRSVQINERKLRARFPNLTKGIRAFHQSLLSCQGEHASLLVTLNIERLKRLLDSPQYSRQHFAPLLEINTLVECILQSIPGQSRKLTGRVFAWLSWARRPLNVEELSAALRFGWDFPPAADSPEAIQIRYVSSVRAFNTFSRFS